MKLEGMTVADVIAALQKEPSNLKVAVHGLDPSDLDYATEVSVEYVDSLYGMAVIIR